MKGIVFNLLEEAVVEAHGPGAWDRVLDDAGVDGVICGLAGASADAVPRDFGRAALPGLVARPPRFAFGDPAPGALVVHDVSERRLRAMAEGMIEAAAPHVGERAALEQTECMRRGAPRCTFVANLG